MWRLPGPRRFVDELLALLWEGTVFVHLPHGHDADALRDELGRSEPAVAFAPVPCGEVVRSTSPWAAVAEWLGCDGSNRWSASQLLGDESLRRVVIWLHGFEELNRDEAELLAELLSQVDEARPDDGIVRLPTLVVSGVGTCNATPLTREGRRRMKVWWGVLSRLDVAVSLLEQHDMSPVLRDQIVEVAGFDLRLADALAAEADERPPAFHAVCREHGELLGITPSEPPRRPRWTAQHPGDFSDQWAQGLVDLTDGAPLRHVNAYAGTAEIDRRMWIGQVHTLLPSLDLLRMELLTIATRHRLIPPGSTNHELDFGALTKLLEASEERHQLLPIARWMRTQRNRLAHLELVTMEDRRTGLGLAMRTGLHWRPAGLDAQML